jgi:small subunit ribosomal protein S6
MRRYETIIIIDSDLSEEIREQLINKIKNLIVKLKGTIIKFDEWGVKKLAYEIKKKIRGYYICIDFASEITLIDELERSFRIDDKVLKYMTTLAEKDINAEKVKEIILKEEEAKEENKNSQEE